MRWWLLTAALLTILMVGFAEARRHHHRHYGRMAIDRSFDPDFCTNIIQAFSTLTIKDLDAFVDTIPPRSRRRARECLRPK